MTGHRTRTRRLAAIVLAMTALAALLPAATSAAAPARATAEPEHAYAVIRGVGGPEGIVMLEERPAGLFVGIGMTGVAFRAVSLYGATAPCGFVGFSTVRLGTFHPVHGRFAAGYIAGAADAVDTIASVRLMAGNHLVACRTLVWGDRDGVSCDVDPEQADCPRPEYAVPVARRFERLLRLGVMPFFAERPNGAVAAILLAVRPVAYRLILGDASCADGGGERVGKVVVVEARHTGYDQIILPMLTIASVLSYRFLPFGGTATCVDLGLFQTVVG